MRDTFQPVRLTRSRRAGQLTGALLLGTVLVAGCTGGSARPAASASATPVSTVSGCASCISPRLFQVAYGIAPLLDQGLDGRGETVTFLAGASSSGPASSPPPSAQGGPVADQGPASDTRQSLKAFDAMFSLPAAQVEVVNTLAQAASPWHAAGQEIQDAEMMHAVGPAATLRVVLLPANALANAATATADMIAGLRVAVSGTNVVSVNWSLGEHFFSKSQAGSPNPRRAR